MSGECAGMGGGFFWGGGVGFLFCGFFCREKVAVRRRRE